MKNNTSNSHSNSASGLATIVGIAGLGHLRKAADSPKSLILNAEIYLGSPSCEALIGALRFYNGQNMQFTNDLTLYLIYATFARTCIEDGVNIQPVLDADEYKFIGDLQWVIPLAEDTSSETTSYLIDPCHCMYVYVSGMATNVQKDAGTFSLDIEQYIYILKDSKNNSKTIKPLTPISCIFPDSPRFQNEKPVPYDNRFVSVSGFLTDVVNKNQSKQDSIDHFVVTVDHIAFLGTQSTSNLSSIIPNTLDSSLKPQKKGLIDYSSSHTNKKRALPPKSPVSEEPPSKRQQVDPAKTK